ncbi:putative flavin-binding monooxygenase [Aspergillus steynii IBT 23096]|uniref:Putative flavin-binding monooxygenase n=1 Tax=Aspergillus steynii IBT 23096 TaxID=1392250 RepID=A0A2I2G7D2_9EURO|nr:putative flavin-binding monooxygenase [Aspergillus steynii IBT 23096]PLB48799.1 putative flavin-binding monooxygenase [Aspergillus steynii IBT 23096]
MDQHCSREGNLDYDVIIIGAGISGINTAYRIQSEIPNCSYIILEARDALGGTWDLFRYPGIRSDSDLFTFGFSWYLWPSENPIAEASSILQYMKEASESFGIDKNIFYQHKVTTASWISSEQTWRLQVIHDGHPEPTTLNTRFVVLATGYYDYHQPLASQIPGLENFTGRVIHPQFWPHDFDCTDRNVVIIGSGATAITLVPKLAEKAERVTMLQRSPSYIMSLPNRRTTTWLGKLLPSAIASRIARFRKMITSRVFFLFCRAFPIPARWLLRHATTRQLPKHIPYDPHFNPKYNPWDQRLCICPDGDFYAALHTGKVDVITDTIAEVQETGITLNSGAVLKADSIITATGLKLQFGGGIEILVDEKRFDMSQKFLWRGNMLQDLPNVALVIGYTNASWTLGADTTGIFISRLLRDMEKRNIGVAVPRLQDVKLDPCRLLDLNSTYVNAAERNLPKAALQAPWKPRDNYFSDLMFAKYGRLDDSLELVNRCNWNVNSKKHL